MTKTFNFKIDWLFWFLILAPTFYKSGVETRSSQMEFFKIAIIVLVALFHSNRWIGAFLGYMVFQFLFFIDSPGISTIIPNVFFAAVLYHFITKYSEPSSFKKYLSALYGVLIFNCFWITLQINQIDPVWNQINFNIQKFYTEFPGFFTLPAFLGNFAAAVVALSFPLNFTLFPFSLIALFFGKSTFSIVAAWASSLFYFWFKKRIIFWVILFIFGIAGNYYIFKFDKPNGQFSRRLSAWGIMVKKSFTKQFFGHGIGSYGSKYVVFEVSPSMNNSLINSNEELFRFVENDIANLDQKKIDLLVKKDKNEVVNFLRKMNPSKVDALYLKDVLFKYGIGIQAWTPAHNEYLQVFFDMGLIGVLIIFGYIFDMFRRFFLYWNGEEITLALMSSFIAIIIVSFGHFPFQIARLSAPFISILALLDTCLLRRQYDSQ